MHDFDIALTKIFGLYIPCKIDLIGMDQIRVGKVVFEITSEELLAAAKMLNNPDELESKFPHIYAFILMFDRKIEWFTAKRKKVIETVRKNLLYFEGCRDLDHIASSVWWTSAKLMKKWRIKSREISPELDKKFGKTIKWLKGKQVNVDWQTRYYFRGELGGLDSVWFSLDELKESKKEFVSTPLCKFYNYLSSWNLEYAKHFLGFNDKILDEFPFQLRKLILDHKGVIDSEKDLGKLSKAICVLEKMAKNGIKTGF